jgi:hypothetical protein
LDTPPNSFHNQQLDLFNLEHSAIQKNQIGKA